MEILKNLVITLLIGIGSFASATMNIFHHSSTIATATNSERASSSPSAGIVPAVDRPGGAENAADSSIIEHGPFERTFTDGLRRTPQSTQSRSIDGSTTPALQRQRCLVAPHVVDLAGHFSAARSDSEYVFDYYCNVLDGAQSKTFIALDFYFGKDASGVWMLVNPSDEWDNFQPRIVGADPRTFSLLPHSGGASIYDEGYSRIYSKDANHVYYLGQIVPEADAQSFVVDDVIPKETPTSTKWDNFDAQDRGGRFYRGVSVTRE